MYGDKRDEWGWGRDEMTDATLLAQIELLGELLIAGTACPDAAEERAVTVAQAVSRLASMRPWTLASGCCVVAMGSREAPLGPCSDTSMAQVGRPQPSICSGTSVTPATEWAREASASAMPPAKPARQGLRRRPVHHGG